MRVLSPLDAIAFSELLDLCREDPSRSPFKPNGSFVKQKRGARDYWYFRGYEKPADGSPGKATLRYAGIVDDPAVEAAVAGQRRANATFKTRHDLASRLRRAGLPAPLPMEGAIMEALAEVGLFERGAIMVGSIAFQTFGGLLGTKLDAAPYRTKDIDFAQPAALRIGAEHAGVDLLPILQAVDPTFEPMFPIDQPGLASGYRNASNFRVEFLATERSAKRRDDGLVPVAGLAGVGAQQLRFLEFLLKSPVRSVMLHGAGVPVLVPDPMRYAVHKLMVSVLRGPAGGQMSKSIKDIRQSETIITASVHARTTVELGRAWTEAWSRGPSWRKVLRDGTLKLAEQPLALLAAGAAESGSLDGHDNPFLAGEEPRQALIDVHSRNRS